MTIATHLAPMIIIVSIDGGVGATNCSLLDLYFLQLFNTKIFTPIALFPRMVVMIVIRQFNLFQMSIDLSESQVEKKNQKRKKFRYWDSDLTESLSILKGG
jgi:hypothetical protein